MIQLTKATALPHSSLQARTGDLQMTGVIPVLPKEELQSALPFLDGWGLMVPGTEHLAVRVQSWPFTRLRDARQTWLPMHRHPGQQSRQLAAPAACFIWFAGAMTLSVHPASPRRQPRRIH